MDESIEEQLKREKKTTLSISIATRDRLIEYGKMKETVDDLINRLLDIIDKYTNQDNNTE